ncbi:MAG: WXG100 family type VII secretion target [Chloroflexi bacterium]|jgi:WXG100 family type VII secretion target|nr:WXG100 family type VII secretion target [Chloroflexota bacterium]
MAELTIAPEKLVAAAADFEESGKSLTRVIESLDLTTTTLKEDWEGASQQLFYKQYTDIRQYLQGFAGLLDDISTEMKAMAERYGNADN